MARALLPCCRSLSVALTVALVLSACAPPVTHRLGSPVFFSRFERAHLLNGDYTLFQHVSEIPPALKRAFMGDRFAMADSEDEWQATDNFIVGENVKPTAIRRLLLAGCTPWRCFLHYAKGGLGVAYYVVVFDVQGAWPRFRWGGVGFKSASDLPTLRSLVESGAMEDRDLNDW